MVADAATDVAAGFGAAEGACLDGAGSVLGGLVGCGGLDSGGGSAAFLGRAFTVDLPSVVLLPGIGTGTARGVGAVRVSLAGAPRLGGGEQADQPRLPGLVRGGAVVAVADVTGLVARMEFRWGVVAFAARA